MRGDDAERFGAVLEGDTAPFGEDLGDGTGEMHGLAGAGKVTGETFDFDRDAKRCLCGGGEGNLKSANGFADSLTKAVCETDSR